MILGDKFSLTKKKAAVSSIIFLAYFISIILPRESHQCLLQVTCDAKPHHTVPSSYLGSTCGQICATYPELLVGYVISALVHLVFPAVLIYAVVSLMFLGVERIRK